VYRSWRRLNRVNRSAVREECDAGGLGCEPGSLVSMVSGYGLDDWAVNVYTLQRRQETCVSRPALGLTQPPLQWVLEGPLSGSKARTGSDAGH
jgi:hypothetical protein